MIDPSKFVVIMITRVSIVYILRIFIFYKLNNSKMKYESWFGIILMDIDITLFENLVAFLIRK